MIPAFFAEVLLRVYTKNTDFFGVVQAGYRAVLKKMEDESKQMDDDNNAFDNLFPLPFISNGGGTPTAAAEPPSTPRVFSRNPSMTLGTAPFSNNSFTTVSPTFKCTSPTGAPKKLKSRKRIRENEDTSASDSGMNDKSPLKKKLKE